MLKSRWVNPKFAALARAQATRDRRERLRLEDFDDELSIEATHATLKSLWIMKQGGMSWSDYVHFLAHAPSIRTRGT